MNVQRPSMNVQRPSIAVLVWFVLVLVAGVGSAWITIWSARDTSLSTEPRAGTGVVTALGVVALCVACAGLGWLLTVAFRLGENVVGPGAVPSAPVPVTSEAVPVPSQAVHVVSPDVSACPTSPASPVEAPSPQAPGSEVQADRDRALRERSCLVGLCMDLHDVVERPALRERIVRVLADAGVAVVVPLDAVFDPDQEEVVTSVTTDDPSRVGRVASVERVGFRDRGQLLRPAEVVVYVQPQAH